MIIRTESGSEYYIRNGILNKKNDNYTAYKVSYMKAVPDGIESFDEIDRLPKSNPIVGQRLYVCGWKGWNLTTKVVEIIKEDND
jgi:hypothetical protein